MGTTGSTSGTPVGGGTVLGGDGVGLEPTCLSVARYGEIMQIDQPHLFQMDGALAPKRGGCDADIWDQDDREALVQAIQDAEAMIAEELGTFPCPTWVVDEEIRVGRVRSDWWNAEFTTRWKLVEAFGTQTLTLLLADAPVTYTDEDGDPLGREETATVGAPGVYSYMDPCADECAVQVFFRSDDGAWDDHDPRFRVRNLREDIDGSVMYVKGESSWFIQPPLWTLTRYDCYGTDDWEHAFTTDNLVSYVDVYCESVNTYLPVTLYWEGVCTCGTPCAHTTQTACAYATDLARGHFAPRPATGANQWTAATYSYPPVKMTVSYKAGWPLNSRNCRMDSRLERAIVKLTNVLLPEPPCGFCDPARTRWERDRALMEPLTEAATLIPWGLMERGAFEAWRLVRSVLRGGHAPVRGS